MSDIDVYEVVKKLIGPIEPVGESHTDEKRHENLNKFIDLIDSMLNDVHHIEYSYKNNHQYSMKHASNLAKKALDNWNIQP